MDKKLNDILKTQQVIVKNQATILETVLDVSKQISNNHQEVMRELSTLSKQINFVAIQIKDLKESQCQDCLYLSKQFKIDYKTKRYPSYKQLDSLVTNFRTTKLSNCMNFLSSYTIGSNGKSVNSFYYMQTYDTTPDNERLIKHNIRMFKIASELCFNGDSSITPEQKMLSLYFPASNFQELNNKLMRGDLTSKSSYLPRDPEVMQNIVSPEACQTLAEVMCDLHYLFNVTDSDNKLIPLSAIQPGYTYRTTGYSFLQEALKMVNLTIAQQSLLSGDILLETISRRIDAGKIQGEFLPLLSELLNGNNQLTQNFITYSIKRKALKKGSISQYKLAYELGDSTVMKHLLALPFDPTFIPKDTKYEGRPLVKGWYMRVDKSLHKLPEPNLEVEAVLSYDPILTTLLTLRQDILNEMASYETYMDADDITRQSINYGLLRQLKM